MRLLCVRSRLARPLPPLSRVPPSAKTHRIHTLDCLEHTHTHTHNGFRARVRAHKRLITPRHQTVASPPTHLHPPKPPNVQRARFIYTHSHTHALTCSPGRASERAPRPATVGGQHLINKHSARWRASVAAVRRRRVEVLALARTVVSSSAAAAAAVAAALCCAEIVRRLGANSVTVEHLPQPSPTPLQMFAQ